MRRAVNTAETAGKNLRKLATLLANAVQDFADYSEIIAPGSGLSRAADPDTMPSGERILRESEERDAKFGAFVRNTAQSSDEVREKAKGLTDFVEKIGGRHSGGTATTTSTPTPPPPQSSPTAGDHAGNIMVVGLAAAVVAKRIRDKFTKWRADRRGQQPI